MTPLQVFMKLATPQGVAAFCKMISSGEIESPLSKSEWNTVIEATADHKIKDPPGKPLSRAQKFARFISSGTGLEMYRTMKVSPGREVEGVAIGTSPYRASTPMAVVSDSDDAAHLAAATRLEAGRAARTRAAMRPDFPSRSYRPGEDEDEGGAENAARARAARRMTARPERSFERHHADVIAADPELARRVLAEERNRAEKRLRAGP